jgi:hypothetical protein
MQPSNIILILILILILASKPFSLSLKKAAHDFASSIQIRTHARLPACGRLFGLLRTATAVSQPVLGHDDIEADDVSVAVLHVGPHMHLGDVMP